MLDVRAGGGAERLAEGLVVPVVQMGEEEEKTWVVPRAEDQSTVVLWAGAADKGMGAVERGLRPCFPLCYIDSKMNVSFDSNWRACTQFQLYVHLRIRIKR